MKDMRITTKKLRFVNGSIDNGRNFANGTIQPSDSIGNLKQYSSKVNHYHTAT